jgi:pilus assembly protein Flp/PilA
MHFSAMEIEPEPTMNKFFSRFLKDESGATAIEYGLIAGLIGVVIITAVRTLGTNVSAKFNAIAQNLT